jgi:hypothetical protein
MDLSKAIQELNAEKERLEQTIALLEDLQRKYASHRGRKAMDSEERKLVSVRMRKYWAGRRNGPSSSSLEPKRSGK